MLAPADAVGSSRFGSSLALSSDGTEALIGGDTDNGLKGAAWVYSVSGGTWSEEQKIATPADEVQGSSAVMFGITADLSADGTVALIGGEGDNDGTGAAWVYTRSGSTWSEQQKLTGSSRLFGRGLALSATGSTALISGTAASAGDVWEYTSSGGTWSEQQNFGTPSWTRSGRPSSAARSLSPGTARLRSSARRRSAEPVPARRPTNAARRGPTPRRRAGASSRRSGRPPTRRRGAPSAPRSPCRRTGTRPSPAGLRKQSFRRGLDLHAHRLRAWSEQQKIIPTDIGTGGLNQLVGTSVAISPDGNTVAFGSTGIDGGVGAVWVYTRSGSTWSEAQEITAPADGTGEEQFGRTLALAGNGTTLLVGGP